MRTVDAGTEHPHFDVCGPLPTGLTLLEASAGTGKTYTVAALVVRYIAEGTPIEQLLVVTFTKAATSELRERVRDRLVATEAGIRRIQAGGDGGGDSVLDLLADGTADEVEGRRRRVADALAHFDAATITTTHGFCEHILAGLGTTGDVDRDITFVTDPGDLVTEVVDDLYLRKFVRGDPPPFTRSEALDIGRRAIDNPEAPIAPAQALAGEYPVEVMRARLAQAVRREVSVRKLRHATMGYDDLLTRLAETLRSPRRGEIAARRLRERYRVVLVDEFQDTDPIQWDILHLAFGTGTTLVLIGDPKQAIYSFRGADVGAYLDAARRATTTATLGVNRRSDQGLLDALDAVFDGASLGAGIAYRRVRAACGRGVSLEGAPHPAPLRVRVVHRRDGAVTVNADRDRTVKKDSGRAVVATDLADDVVELLSSGAALAERDAGGAETGRRPIGPGDLAVLVQTNADAELVRATLHAAGVAAVVGGAGSVFATDIAGQWLQLLRALERPQSQPRARAAALTGFVGWTPATIAAATEAELADLQATLHTWAALLAHDGVASLLESVSASQELPARLLAGEGGERQLTDLRHVGQLLHAEAVSAQLGTTALTGWLQRRMTEAGRDAGADDRTRRLESDADAVQVITVYRSKGLEFPIVYLPFLWSPTRLEKSPVPVYHDPDNGNVRTLDVGGPGGPGHAGHAALYAQEKEGEDLRLAYVALSRARHQVVVWWASSMDSPRSAFGRLLLRDARGGVRRKLPAAPSDDAVVARLEEVATATDGRIAVERSGPPLASTLPVPPAEHRTLDVRSFDRNLDTDWRRTSYTAITAPVHGGSRDPRVGSEPEEPGLADEALPPGAPPAAGGGGDPIEAVMRAVPSPMTGIPGGATTGILVHAVLEAVDFTVPDLDARLLTAARRTGLDPVRDLDPADLATALRTAIETPLGPVADHRALRAVPAADRLDELAFELPLVGGDQPAAALTVAAIGERLRAWLTPDDPLRHYADRLDDPALGADLHGYLAGSIDMVVRIPTDAGGRYVVVDYKTNRLGARDEVLTAWHYRPAALREAMVAAHYPLQALIYSVALHRYLRWRLAGYRPDVHLGGIAYLFVRGMSGPETPVVDGQPAGVFAWHPPAGLIADLSDCFDLGPVPS